MRSLTTRFVVTATAAVALGLGGGRSLSAQAPFAAADSLLTAGDTGAALNLLERWSRRHRRDAEAHYRAAAIYMARVPPGEAASADRRAAEEHLRFATRLEGDSAKYWLALADVYRSQTDVTVRMQVDDVIRRAVEAARAAGGAQVLAEVEYRAGRIGWERYEQRANRYRLSGEVGEIDHDRFLNDWRYVEELFGGRLRPESGGTIEWRVAEEHLQAAVRADSAHLDALGLLVVALIEMARWDSAVAVARRATTIVPDSGGAWTLYGLALARAGRWQEAERAFQTGFDRMAPAGRAPYEHLPLIAGPDDAERFAGLAPEQRAAERARYWSSADPSWLVDGNEVRAEFWARVTYADHRWTDPWRGYRGWEADRGAVYVRYGPPDIMATLGAGGVGTDRVVVVRDPARQRDPFFDRPNAAERLDRERNRVLWVYRTSRQRYIFTLTPGYARAVFGGAARHAFAVDQRTEPTRNDNVPAADTDSIAVIVAQFRGPDAGSTDVAVFGAPEARPSPGSLFGVLVRQGRDEVGRVIDTVRSGSRGPTWWTVPLAPGDYAARVELVDSARGRTGRGAIGVAVRAIRRGVLDASDLMLLRGADAADTARRWWDYRPTPLVGDLSRDRPVGLLWEVYDPPVDASGAGRYRVEVRFELEAVSRRGFVARIVGGVGDALGVTAEGEDAVVLAYDRTVPVDSTGTVVEYLLIDLGDAPAGRYGITVRVTGDPADAEVVVRRTLVRR